MGMVLWCSLQNDAEDYCPDDLGYLYGQIEEVDRICAALGVKPLSDFIDESDLEFDMSEEDLGEDWLAEHTSWFAPDDVLRSVDALLELSDSDDESLDSGVEEELALVRERCITARDGGTRVRLSVVM